MDPMAAAACETILNTIRLSGLNWSIQESPFSLSISIRKTFVKVHEKSVYPSKPNQEAFPIPSHQTPRKTFLKKSLFENKKFPQYISHEDPMCMPSSSPIKYPTEYLSSLSTSHNMCPKFKVQPCEIQFSSSQKVTRLFPKNSQSSQISNRIQNMESRPGLVNFPKPPLPSPTNTFQHIPALMQPLLTPLASLPSSQVHCISYSPNNQLKKVPSPSSKLEINPSSTSKTTSMDSTTTQFTDTMDSINQLRERKDNLTGQQTHAYSSSHKTFSDSMSSQDQLNPTNPTQDQLNTTPTQDQLNTNPTQDQINTPTTLDHLNITTTKDQLNYTATQDQAILTKFNPISEDTFPFKYKPRIFWDDSDSDVDYSDDEETIDDLMRKLELKYHIT